ncbi:phage antirepressor KilAC domain-containing protein [Intestinibacillus sp. Marseille-P6563]|uniref:phage antirepressor KilAC domain-containing protein n=1 Tax=Intestinibacillus sp. Marseille-P6563 TaxID=2364792 RepID=UPI001FAA51AD|nr:phage antirepressor KilAC domain-containing protein [Intestinibacillus sp. Marseille-P6563]
MEENYITEIINISGVECFEKDGTAYLKLESVARGLGFTKTETKNGVEYNTIRWERVFGFLDEFGFDHKWAKDGFIPENIFYRLAMKAKNAAAEAFQAKIADEVIPSIRKHGGYIAGQEEMSAEELMAKALMVAQKTLAEREARISALTVENQIMAPKAAYFDELVDRNLLTGLRETAKELGIQQNKFVSFLLEKKYLYRDRKGKLMPYQTHVDDEIFELKECYNEKTQWGGTQTMVTPKGRETFRLLMVGVA